MIYGSSRITRKHFNFGVLASIRSKRNRFQFFSRLPHESRITRRQFRDISRIGKSGLFKRSNIVAIATFPISWQG